MIRCLLALLIIHASFFSLVSCTSPQTGDDSYAEDDTGPIEDEEGSEDAGADDAVAEEDTGGDEVAEAEEAGQETADAGDSTEAEDDLDAEFEETEGEDVAASTEEDAVADGELDSDVDAGDELDEAPPVEEKVASEPIPAPVPAPEEAAPTPEPEAPEKAKVRDIRYLANSNGGTVVIETSKPVTYQTRLNPGTNQFVIELADVELPANLQRPYHMKDFNSRIGGINAYQTAGSSTARVVVQLSNTNGSEPTVQQEGNALVVIPPSAPVVAKRESAPAPSQTISKPAQGEQALAARTLDEFLTGNQKFFGRNISLQIKDGDVRDVVNFLAEESGANIVMSDDVSGKISLKLRRVPWDQALVTVMRTRSLGYVRQGNVLRISTLKALQAETEAANKIIEAQKAIVPMVVQVVPISYADIDDLAKNLKPFLSKEGNAVADKRTSTLIITDKGETVERAKKLVKTLDIPPAQVSIESKIVEAMEEFDNFIGVNWGFSGNSVELSPNGGADKGPINLDMNLKSSTLSQEFVGANPFSMGMTIGSLDIFGNLDAALTLAERDSLAKVISSPRISAMNREKAVIRQEGENVSFIQTRSETTGAITRSEKRTPFSLELAVTPQITSDGGVIMDLAVKREFVGPVLDQQTQARAVNKRSATSKILVRNGQTAVIGGIYTSDELDSSMGVPGLKNIPIIGWLFKSKSYSRQKNELLIFLTPRILAQDVGMDMAASGGGGSIGVPELEGEDESSIE